MELDVNLSTNLDDQDAIAYFTWDDPMTVAEIKERLRTGAEAESARLLGKILREARDTDVWQFTAPEEVVRRWNEVAKHLGRRRAFWEWLLGSWREMGLDDRLDGAERTLQAIAASLQGATEAVTRTPDFRRWVLRALSGSVIIDLVRDRAPQIHPDKPTLDGIRVDPPDEILANKLSALLGRSELRDLVDVRALELAGHRVEDALRSGTIKDASLTPAQLGWVLSQITLGDETRLPGGGSVPELRSYLAGLVARLARLGHP